MDDKNENIRFAIKAQRVMGMKGDHWENHAVASEILHAELGYGDAPRTLTYHLDADTRDVLLAHVRQDAAHALCNTTSLLRRVRTLTGLVWVLLGVVVLQIILDVAPRL